MAGMILTHVSYSVLTVAASVDVEAAAQHNPRLSGTLSAGPTRT